MPLTDMRIRQAKPAAKVQKMADGGGLFLEVRTNGSKLWRYQYRIAGKPNLFAIGAYPALSLQDARAAHAKARALVKAGTHPAHDRARQKGETVAANADTFQVVADEWLAAKRGGWSEYYATQVSRYFVNDVYPKIGRRPMRSIVSADILQILRTLADRGATSPAILIRRNISQVFAYAVATLRADADPAYVLRGAIIRPAVQGAAPKTPTEIRELVKRVNRYGGARVTAIAIRLLLLMFVRTAEMRHARWSEIDIDAGLWTIPAAKMKKRRIHVVPLARQSIELLTELREITGSNQHLFPNVRRPKDVMHPMTVNRALQYMGYPSGDFTGHDFRATASTLLHEMGYRSELVEMQLAHAKGDKIAAVYNHAQYLPERTAMMQAWADWLDHAASRS